MFGFKNAFAKLKKNVAVVASAVSESIAPLMRTNIEQFQYSWLKIDEEYGNMLDSNDLNNAEILTNSRMSEHLNALVTCIVTEERQMLEQDWAEGGPCYEYMVQHQVIEKICEYGLADRPPGMRCIITQTLQAIFTNIRQPILPNQSVHIAVRQFVDVCILNGDDGIDKSDNPKAKRAGKKQQMLFVRLLLALLERVSDYESLATVFFDEDTKMKPGEKRYDFPVFNTLLHIAGLESSNRAKLWTQKRENTIAEATAQGHNISLVESEAVWDLALRGCVQCLLIRDEKVSQYIVHDSTFIDFIIKRTGDAWDAMIMSDADADMNQVDGLDKDTDTKNSKNSRIFWHRFKLVDWLMESTYGTVQTALVDKLMTDFLPNHILPLLLAVKEEVLRNATTRVQAMLMSARSKPLKTCIAYFLLDIQLVGTTRIPPSRSAACPQGIQRTLIMRLDNLSDDVSVATLALFVCLVSLHDENIMNALGLKHVISEFKSKKLNTMDVIAETVNSDCFYIEDIKCKKLESVVQYFPNLTKADICGQVDDTITDAKDLGQDGQTKTEGQSVKNKTIITDGPSASDIMTGADIIDLEGNDVTDSIVNTSSSEGGNTIEKNKRVEQAMLFDEHLRASLFHIHECVNTVNTTWYNLKVNRNIDVRPNAAVAIDNAGEDKEAGLFLSVVLNKFQSFLDNSLDQNVLLTALFSSIAVYPHPLLHAYMYSTSVDVKDNQDASVRLPMDVFIDVWNRAMEQSHRVQSFDKRYADFQKRLLGNVGGGIYNESADQKSFFHSMILLKEFLVELLAILTCKKHVIELLNVNC